MALDLNALKETLQTILSTANDTAAAYDLSTSLTTRVQRVVKLNPALINVQSNWYPFVSCYVESKDVELKDMVGTQLASKRQGDINLRIMGAVEVNLHADPETDEADDECEQLMENIEEVLRRNPTLDGRVLWQYPVRVKYYNQEVEEGACVRVGLLDLKATLLY